DSGEGSESESDENPLSDSMQAAIFRARKAGGMAKAMTDLNAKGKAKKDGWSKYNFNEVSRESAELALKAAAPGAWLVRKGSTGQTVVSYIQDGKMVHAEIDKS